MALEYAWLMPLALVALMALVAVAWHLLKTQRKEAITENLDANGKKAVEALRSAGGRMRQKTLQERLHLSAPRFNKLLRELEEIEAIRRVVGPRENEIELLI